MTEHILDEYMKITRTIENIQNKINQYKKIVEANIENSKNEEEQEEKIREFKKIIHRIKKDKEITRKYRLLKKKQKELRDSLVTNRGSLEGDETNLVISDLKSKYSLLSKHEVLFISPDDSPDNVLDNVPDNVPDDVLDDVLDNVSDNHLPRLTNRDLQNIKFEMVLRQVQKNLGQDSLKYQDNAKIMLR